MNEERKAYTIIGRVEIGTDEYRDLIEAVQEAKAEESHQRGRWLDEYNRADELEKKVKELEPFKNFVTEKNLISDFKLWRIEGDGDKE